MGEYREERIQPIAIVYCHKKTLFGSNGPSFINCLLLNMVYLRILDLIPINYFQQIRGRETNYFRASSGKPSTGQP
jgi:hypothetical protein